MSLKVRPEWQHQREQKYSWNTLLKRELHELHVIFMIIDYSPILNKRVCRLTSILLTARSILSGFRRPHRVKMWWRLKKFLCGKESCSGWESHGSNCIDEEIFTVQIKFRMIEPQLNFTYSCSSRLVSVSNTPYRMDVIAFPDKSLLKKGTIWGCGQKRKRRMKVKTGLKEDEARLVEGKGWVRDGDGHGSRWIIL